MHPNLPTHPLARRDFLKGSMMGAATFAAGYLPIAPQRAERRAYLGTYTEGTASEGLYRCRFNASTGALRVEGVTKGMRNPSFLAFHPDGETLYAVEEVSDRGRGQSGGVVAFAIDPSSGWSPPLERCTSREPSQLSQRDTPARATAPISTSMPNKPMKVRESRTCFWSTPKLSTSLLER